MELRQARLERPRRILHPRAGFEWGKAEDICPDFNIDARGPDGKPVDVFVVCFKDPDGEEHLFAFSTDGKEKFLTAGRGGLVVTSAMPKRNGDAASS